MSKTVKKTKFVHRSNNIGNLHIYLFIFRFCVIKKIVVTFKMTLTFTTGTYGGYHPDCKFKPLTTSTMVGRKTSGAALRFSTANFGRSKWIERKWNLTDKGVCKLISWTKNSLSFRERLRKRGLITKPTCKRLLQQEVNKKQPFNLPSSPTSSIRWTAFLAIS